MSGSTTAVNSKSGDRVRETPRIFVSNIPGNTDRKVMIKYFSQFGRIADASTLYKIGRRGRICIEIEFYDLETKNIVLNTVHKIKGRYIDCEEYLTGKRLQSRNLRLREVNVYIPILPPSMDNQQVKEIFERLGKVEQVRMGFSNTLRSNYCVVSFSDKETAQRVVGLGSIEAGDLRIPIQPYSKGPQPWVQSPQSENQEDSTQKEADFRGHMPQISEHFYEDYHDERGDFDDGEWACGEEEYEPYRDEFQNGIESALGWEMVDKELIMKKKGSSKHPKNEKCLVNFSNRNRVSKKNKKNKNNHNFEKKRDNKHLMVF